MRKLKIAVIVLSSITITSGLCIILLLLMWANKVYPPWADLPEGIRSESQLIEHCVSEAKNPVTLEFPDESVTIQLDSIVHVSVHVCEQSFLDFLSGVAPDIQCTWIYNSKKLRDVLNENYKKAKNASIIWEENGKVKLVKEYKGHDFSVSEVERALIAGMKEHNFSFDMEPFLRDPEVSSKDLKESYDYISWVNDWHISYSSGYTIGTEDLRNCWDGRTNFDIDKMDMSSIIANLKEQYETTGGQLEFRTTKGSEITVPYNTFGVSLNVDKETAYINDAILNKVSESNREPFTYGYDEFNGTYIEVSLGDQHVYHYVDGALCCQSDCVTGTKGRHDTPTGVFYVSEKINGKNLRGDDYVTWVNKWMRLTNTGVGLHDAYWRGSFGKNIYTYSGSHGCINLPSRYAYSLYDEISTGIPVVVY